MDNNDPAAEPNSPASDPRTEAKIEQSGDGAAVIAQEAPPRRIGVVGEIDFAGVALAAALVRNGLVPRILSPDANSVPLLARRLPANSYEVISGNLGDRDAIQATLDGTYAAAFLSPIAMSGRLYRADSHVEDVQRFLQAAEKSTLRSVVYHSSTAARLATGSRALGDAAKAEELVQASRCTAYRLSTGPLMGAGDGFLSTLVPRVRSASPVLGVLGYGNAEFQPLHVDDFAACVARVFDAAEPVAAGIYGITGPELKSWLELMDEALELIGSLKVKFHAPLFLTKLATMGSKKTLAEEVALSQERFALEKSDTSTFLGTTRLKTCTEVLRLLLS